jgi:translation initiation factor IF-2
MEEESPKLVKVAIPQTITIKDLAEKLEIKVSEVVGELFKNGVMATINDSIDYDTASVILSDLGFETYQEEAETETPKEKRIARLDESAATRPPVVAVMGHVDHGKTTLLDAIRKSDVARGEAGGITQHLSAYQITYNGHKITFLDTPGHEAFSILREHGAGLTDVALIVVAADEGIKPQTEEVITYATKSGVRTIVAITKIDKPNADVNRIKQQLSEKGLMAEEWGGDTVTVEVSAKDGTNLDKLLDVILLVAEVDELRANTSGYAEGAVIEAHMNIGKGPVATLLVEHGELKKGDYITVGKVYGRARTLEDSNGHSIDKAEPATPVLVAGWKGMPDLGGHFHVVNNEKEAKIHSMEFSQKIQTQQSKSIKKISQEDKLTAAMDARHKKQLPLLVKADVDGSLKSLITSIGLLGNEEIEAKIVDSGVGGISESDVAMASSSQSEIIGFNVSINGPIKQLAARSKVKIKLYRVIYELLDDIKSELEEKLGSEIVEEVVGELEVKGIFRTSRTDLICGGLVTSGKLVRDLSVRTTDEEIEPFGTIKKLQKEQQPAEEISEGNMCGVEITTTQKANVTIGDKLIFVRRSEQAKKLDK